MTIFIFLSCPKFEVFWNSDWPTIFSLLVLSRTKTYDLVIKLQGTFYGPGMFIHTCNL